MSAWLNPPNLLTLLRLILTPVIAWTILAGRPALALLIFAAAAFTDYLDGAIARRLHLSTQTGAVLDPIADKCLLSGIFLAMAAARIVPWWFVAIVFGRDLYILAGAGVLLLTTDIRRFPPSIWGKVSTCVQIGAAIACLLNQISRGFIHFGILHWLAGTGLWICSAFTLWSGVHYTWRAVQIGRKKAETAH